MKKAFAAALSLVLGSTEYGLFASDWPMLGHDPARSDATVDEVRPPFARKWYRLFPEEGIQSGVQPILAELNQPVRAVCRKHIIKNPP